MNSRLQSAHDYHDRRLPITLCPPGEKKPLGEGWSATGSGMAWQNKRWTKPEISRAYRLRGDLNVGCLWGPKSNMIDIEEDAPAAKEAFAELFEGVGGVVTPTFQSSRGQHRLYAWNSRLEQLGKATVHFKDLEIKIGANGKGSQSLLPPSESSDFTRHWLVSFDECDPAPLPELVIHRIISHQATAKQEASSRLQRDGEYRETEAISSVLSVPSVSLSLCKEASEAIDKAIVETLPDRPGLRDRKLFEFTRRIKAIPSLSDADVKSLRPLVQRWHTLALPVIGTKPFEESWIDFVNGCRNVKFPAGQEPIRMIFTQSISETMPAIAANYETIEVRRLIVFCRALQRTAGDKPFFLACRTAGDLLGISHMLANKWLNLLVFDEVLSLECAGTQGKANRYRYHGD